MHPTWPLHNSAQLTSCISSCPSFHSPVPHWNAESVVETSPGFQGTDARLCHPTAPSSPAPGTRWFRSSTAVGQAPKLETLGFAKLHHPRRRRRVMEGSRMGLLIPFQKEGGPLQLCWS